MTNKSNSVPKLIDDAPALKDRLGAHKRIAETLCTIIKSNKGGKTIALEGEWGAGKSTVINLTTQLLEKSKDHKVVLYDAWVHSGDPLRRAFLNSIIDALLSNKWLVKETHWLNTKEHLSRRRKDSIKTTTPTFTTFGQILLLLLLLLPLTGVVFSGLYMSMAKNGFDAFELLSITGIGLLVSGGISILPFLLVLLRALHAWCTGNKSTDWALILNKSSVTESTSTIETPDPTTIEFQSVFQEVVTEALDGNRNKLILVIDNLDRLPEDEAELVWSMLRSFIDNPAYKSAKWHERLWIVIPVALNKNQTTAGEIPDEFKFTKRGKFLEKVFQVKLSLPPPVLADWKNYLINLLWEAFLENEKEHFSNVHRIYEAYIQETRGTSQTSPTPRELVIFTNELVTMKIQWGEKFNIAYLAAYLLAARNKNVLSALQKREIPSLRTRRLLDSTDVTKEFATIYFNIEDGNKAQQLLLRPVIEESLIKGNEVPLINNLLADSGVEHVIESVLDELVDDWSRSNPDLLFNALIALNHVSNPADTTPSKSESEHPNIKYVFSNEFSKYIASQGINAINNWPALPASIDNCARGVCSLLELIQDNRVEIAVIDAIKRMAKLQNSTKETQDRTIPDAENIDSWTYGIKHIVRIPRIKSLLPINSNNPIQLPISPELWGNFCYEFDDNKHILSAFIPVAGLNQIKDYIINECIKQFKFSWNDHYAIKRELILSNHDFTNSISRAVTPQVFSQPVLTADFLESLLFTAFTLAKDSETTLASLPDIVNSGWLHHHLHAVATQNESECAAIIILTILKIRPDATLPAAVGNASAGQGFIQKVIAASPDVLAITDEVVSGISDLSMHRLLLDLSIKAAAAKPLISHATNILLESKEDLENIFSSFALTSVDAFASEVDAFSNAASNEKRNNTRIQSDIIRFNIQHRNLLTLYANETSLELKNTQLLNITLTEGGKDDKKFIQKCIGILQNVDELTWEKNIETYTWIVKTVEDLLGYRNKTNLGEPLRNALLSLAKKTIKSESAIKIETKHLVNLVNGLADVHKHSFADDVFGIVSQQNIDIAPLFWEKFGFAVSNAAQRLSIKGRTVRTVVKPMITRPDISGLKWFAGLLEDVGIKRIDDDEIAINDLVEAAISYIHQSNANQEMTECLKKIIILLDHADKLNTNDDIHK